MFIPNKETWRSLQKKKCLLLQCIFFLFLYPILCSAQTTKPYFLSVCAIFKNEAPFLKEWLEYHKIVGVEHFYLYNNGSDDDYLRVLQPYIDAKEVTLFDWPNQKQAQWKNYRWAWVYTTQISSYEHAFQLAKNSSQWIAAIDVDEFLVPVKERSVPKILQKYQSIFPGVQVFWRVYGTAGYERLPEDKLMIEVLRKKSFAYNELNRSYKTILQPDHYLSFAWPPHLCNYTDQRIAYQADTAELVINHYINRSKEFFLAHKVKNKETMDNVTLSPEEIAQMLEVGNDLYDQEHVIQRFIPALRDKIITNSCKN